LALISLQLKRWRTQDTGRLDHATPRSPVTRASSFDDEGPSRAPAIDSRR
jgi:hypothetical protein